LQVNYRYRYRVATEAFDALIDDIRAGRLDDEVPSHGTLARPQFRQHIPAEKGVGPALVEVSEEPVWLVRARSDAEAQA
jgi:NADH-quinone oxidoreductase subunit E